MFEIFYSFMKSFLRFIFLTDIQIERKFIIFADVILKAIKTKSLIINLNKKIRQKIYFIFVNQIYRFKRN